MAKQKSTVEMVAKALSDKGYVVDDVELDKGVITVAALAPHGSTLLDSFKQTEARKWLDSVPDMSIVDVEPELTVEEWEQQYGHVTDDDVAQALAPMIEPEQVRDDLNREIAADNLEDYHNQPIVAEEVEPVAEAAPETPEGEMTMESKLFVCVNECGTVVDHEGDLCPDCAKAFEAVAAKEDALYEQYLSVREPFFDEHPDLAMVFEAMTFRRFLVVRYQTDYPNGTSVIRERKLLPSHVYQAASTEGICVVAYDTYRKEVRTFRVDKFRACRLGECAPEANLPANNVAIFPAAYQHRCKPPRIIHEKSVKGAILNGWSTKPLPQVLVQ